jgi:hypothetical protein
MYSSFYMPVPTPSFKNYSLFFGLSISVGTGRRPAPAGAAAVPPSVIAGKGQPMLN